MSIFRKIKTHIELYLTALCLRMSIPMILRFGDEAMKLELHSFMDEACANHQMTVDELIVSGYEESSENNCLWEWKLIEALERFYKETSWIEVV